MLRKFLALFVAIMALAMAACKPGPAPATPSPSPLAKETPTFTPTPIPQLTPTPVEETLELEKISAGLEKLSSYRIQWVISFDGKDKAGNPVKWETQWLEEHTANPPARRLTFKGPELEGSLILVQIGDKTYVVAGGSCFIGAAPETEALSRFSPDFGISGGKFVGYDTIAGIKAKHYTFDEKAFTGGGFLRVKGDVWIAPEGYALKETLEAYGEDIFYERGEGTLKWAWEVMDINQPFTIEVPPECAQMQPQDIPILADASEMMTAAGFISYKSETPFQEAVKFYKEQMPAKGWAPAEGSMEMANMAMLNFKKDGRSASVTIQAGDKGVIVMIATGR